MEYRMLGTSGLQTSVIGFGCMSLPANKSVSTRLLQQAFDKGINFYDTADLYQKGLNEEMLGAAFTKQRHKVIIATKVGNRWRTDGSGWDWVPGQVLYPPGG